MLLSLLCVSTQTLLLAGEAPQHVTYLAWHNQCLTAQTKDIDPQIKKFEAAIAANPNDNLAKAYLGSAYALRAKGSFWGPTKLSYLKRGKKLMDSAVAADPNNLRVRMVRAIAYSKVPKRFKVRATSVADFEKILPLAAGHKTSLATNERQAICYYAYTTYLEEGHIDAAKTKAICRDIDPNSKYGKLTQ